MLFFDRQEKYTVYEKKKRSLENILGSPLKVHQNYCIITITDGGIRSSRSGKGHDGASAEFVEREVCPSAE